MLIYQYIATDSSLGILFINGEIISKIQGGNLLFFFKSKIFRNKINFNNKLINLNEQTIVLKMSRLSKGICLYLF